MERPKGAFVTTKARRSALHLPSKRGEKLKAQLARRREDEKSWLFESVNRNLKRGASLTSPRSFAGRGRREAPGEGPGTELPNQKTYRVERSSTQLADPRVHRLHLPHCLAPHPKAALRYGFDLSPQERGEVKKGALRQNLKSTKRRPRDIRIVVAFSSRSEA